jgi:SAM-dependent methyltransferase
MLRRLWSRKEEREMPDARPSEEAFVGRIPERDADHLVDRAFWLVLWRAPSEAERRESLRAIEGGQDDVQFCRRLLVSTEFRLLLSGTQEEDDSGRVPRDVERGLSGLGDDTAFVESAFRALLGRDADPSGRAFYVSQLAQGHRRLSLVKTLICSQEFQGRYSDLCPQGGFVPRDVQLCELANPAKWSNPEWLSLLTSLVVVPADKRSMHRKAYEFTQLLFGLSRLDFVRDDVSVLSVGAGHEPVLYWLANRVARVFATDMYGGVWQTEGALEGDERVLVDADQFAPFPYRRDRLTFLRMDGCRLAFRDETFDVVYSLSSIEHFGGAAGARSAIAEMARVLKPGGLLAVATEYCLSGPPHHEAFQPAQVHALVDSPSLSLVQPIDERVWDRYDYRAIDLRVNPHQTPHMVVTDMGSTFTSIMMFLWKGPPRASRDSMSEATSRTWAV